MYQGQIVHVNYLPFGVVDTKKSSIGVDKTCESPHNSMSVTVRLWSSIREIEPRQI